MKLCVAKVFSFHNAMTTVYIQIFKICKFWGCHKFSIFAIIFLRITSPSKIRKFCEGSLTNVLHMHVTSSLINFLLLSTTRSKSPRLVTCPLTSGLMYRNYPQNISPSTIGVIQNGLKSGVRWWVWRLVWWPFLRLSSMAAATKVKSLP